MCCRLLASVCYVVCTNVSAYIHEYITFIILYITSSTGLHCMYLYTVETISVGWREYCALEQGCFGYGLDMDYGQLDRNPVAFLGFGHEK